MKTLLDVTTQTDFAPLYRELEIAADYGITDIREGECVFTRGTQSRMSGFQQG